MKKKIFTVVLVTCITFFRFSLEANTTNFMDKKINHGTQTFGKEKIDKIQANGYVTLEGTTVTDYLQVNGFLKADNAQVERMTVNGHSILNNCTVNRKSIVCGLLLATSSQFFEELSISSERVEFISCTLNSLRILQVGGNCSKNDKQVVELKGKTKINGPIIFESGNGEVVSDPNSEIIGDIIGGKIRK